MGLYRVISDLTGGRSRVGVYNDVLLIKWSIGQSDLFFFTCLWLAGAICGFEDVWVSGLAVMENRMEKNIGDRWKLRLIRGFIGLAYASQRMKAWEREWKLFF